MINSAGRVHSILGRRLLHGVRLSYGLIPAVGAKAVLPRVTLDQLQKRYHSLSEHASAYAPIVVERASGGGERAYDIYSRLLKDRIVCLHSPVTPAAASSIVAQLLFLEGQDAAKPIFLYINSPGGSVSDGLAIYDTMQYVRCPVHTVCMGMAASMAAVLMAAGAKGARYALPNARLMLHQPHGGASGQASDIVIHAEEILKTRRRLNEIIARHTGQDVKRVDAVMERDYYMTADEAVSFGLVDAVIAKRAEPAQSSA